MPIPDSYTRRTMYANLHTFEMLFDIHTTFSNSYNILHNIFVHMYQVITMSYIIVKWLGDPILGSETLA